jgi:2-keto-4-pentenoate hydratase/2-oxohepta-3-ene-1,7-dioic acid hydratase in catechol pathway
MRLATVRHDDETALFAEVSRGWIGLSDAADMLGVEGLAGVADVGDLWRRGPAAVEAARRVVAGAADIGRPIDLDQLALGPVVTQPATIMCIGLNYVKHVREGSLPVPKEPVLFAKFANTLIGHGEPVIRHRLTEQLDYEGELAVVIGSRAHRVSRADWRSVVAGYTIIHDVSGRDLQKNDVQWIRGKSLDTWAPLGPIFVSADEIPDPNGLRVRTRVNGEIRQDAPTADMIFDVPTLIAFITEAITLQAGDLIATGTPSGVGSGFVPPRWLQPGDVVEIEIDGIGTLRSPIVDGD